MLTPLSSKNIERESSLQENDDKKLLINKKSFWIYFSADNCNFGGSSLSPSSEKSGSSKYKSG